MYRIYWHNTRTGEFLNAKKKFKTSNSLDIDYKLAKQISYYNNTVDINTRNLLCNSNIITNTEMEKVIKRNINIKKLMKKFEENTRRNKYGSEII